MVPERAWRERLKTSRELRNICLGVLNSCTYVEPSIVTQKFRSQRWQTIFSDVKTTRMIKKPYFFFCTNGARCPTFLRNLNVSGFENVYSTVHRWVNFMAVRHAYHTPTGLTRLISVLKSTMTSRPRITRTEVNPR